VLVVGWLFEKIAIIPGNRYFNISRILQPLVEQGTLVAY
jgi:hypothetical protein